MIVLSRSSYRPEKERAGRTSSQHDNAAIATVISSVASSAFQILSSLGESGIFTVIKLTVRTETWISMDPCFGTYYVA